MIKIKIDRPISSSGYWGISEKEIADQLKDLTPGEEIEITINSPGGEVYEGIAIFNLIRDYAKSHKIIVKINGLAASMASYIAIAARTVDKNAKIIVLENSIFLIHNPWCFEIGDYRQLKKTAEYMEKLAAMSGSTYSYVSGKTEKETRDLMDEETYYVGNEIIENGFANEFEQINQNEGETYSFVSNRDNLIINAKLQIEKTYKELQKHAKKDDLEKAVALIDKTFLPSGAPGGLNKSFEPASVTFPCGSSVHLNSDSPAKTGENSNPKQGDDMDKDELKKKHPELYASIFAEGKEAGIAEERERVEAHLKLGEESGSMKLAAQFIREGNMVMENKVQAEYISARMKISQLNARNEDNPPNVNGDGNGGAADTAAMEAAWNSGLSGKDTKGVR